MTGSFVLYPNPAKDIVFVQLEADAAENITLQLTDRQGNLLQTQSASLSPGVSTLSFNISSLPSGSYFIFATADSHKLVGQFIK
jgi:hypothetical protein